MPRLAYFDCPTGIAGDMCLGALIHVGVPLDYLVEKLNLLGIQDEFRFRVERLHHNGQQATKIHVDLLKGQNPTFQLEAGVDAYPTFSNNQTMTAMLTHAQSTAEQVETDALQEQAHTTSRQHHGSHHHHEHHPTHDHQNRHHAHGNHHHAHEHQNHHHAHGNHHHTPSPPVASDSVTSDSVTSEHAPHRHLPEIEAMIRSAGLPPRVEAWSLAIFRELAKAEGYVHGIDPEQVHFHEVGATDAIVDIVGTCLGLDWLGIDHFYCSTLPTGGGTVWAAHGRLPVPTPAVLRLFELHQVPIYSNGIDRELVTPTGAAIVVTLATQFGPPPAMTLQKVGLGAGGRTLEIPNILRLWVGEEMGKPRDTKPPRQGDQQKSFDASLSLSSPLTASSSPSTTEVISVLETQIDDINPQAIGYLFESLFAAGALDVFTQAIGMKKSRPGILLTVICRPDKVSDCETLIFQETTTLGIRHSRQERSALQRQIKTVQTPYGPVRVKIAWTAEQPEVIRNVQPEYEDCAQIARTQNIPWREVHRLALAAWYSPTS